MTWKVIENFNYKINECGDIVSLFPKSKSKQLKQFPDKDGYLKIRLWGDGKYTNFSVHRLVAKTFIDNPDNKPTVNHIDGDKTNNCTYNLEWATYKEQEAHSHSVLGKRPWNCSKVKCVETGEIYDTVSEAASAFNSYSGNISRSIKKGYKIGGYTFEKVL